MVMDRPLSPMFHIADDGEELAGWARLLDQERQSVAVEDGWSAPVMLCGEHPPPGWRDHVEPGGTLIVAAGRRWPWEAAERGSITVTRLVPAKGDRPIAAPCLARRGPGPTDGASLQTHEDRLPKDAGTVDVAPLVSTAAVGAGRVIVVWAPLGQLYIAPGDRLRPFDHRTPVTERVATVDKGRIADLMRGIVADAVTGLGLPYVRPAVLPAGCDAALVMRCDVDGVYGENTARVSQAFARHGIPVSFFLNADLAERYPGVLEFDQRHQVGQHGQRHDVFATETENDANLTAAEQWLLDRLGRQPRGFVAPRGLWNPTLGRALHARGYRYSADFGLVFDALPFTTDEGVLQLPVHPYSPERAARFADEQALARAGVDEQVRYYLDVARTAQAEGRVAHLYGHPELLADLADPLASALADWLADHGGQAWTLEGYAERWWRRQKCEVVLQRATSSSGNVDAISVAGCTQEALEVVAKRPVQLEHAGTIVSLPGDGRVVGVRDGKVVPSGLPLR